VVAWQGSVKFAVSRSRQEAGVYVLKFESGSGSLTRKLTIEYLTDRYPTFWRRRVRLVFFVPG
jgi:hypothetical protein